MPKKIHIISSFICLNCCRQHRLEIGLSQHLALMLKQTTFEELMDKFPEVIEELNNDEFQNDIFQRFICEHGQHDVRFFHTIVNKMSEIVKRRERHYKKVITNYEQYQTVTRHLNKVLKNTTQSHSKIFHSRLPPKQSHLNNLSNDDEVPPNRKK